MWEDIPGGPVVKTPYFSGWGTKIPHAVEPIKKKKSESRVVLVHQHFSSFSKF